MRFLLASTLTKALSPLQWQGPSPLPQRQADPTPAGGQSPRPAPAPPPAGASPPPGRALACVARGPAGLPGTVLHRRGNAVRFLFPPAPTKALSPLPWQGPSTLPQRHADPTPAGFQSPRPAPAPPPAGRALASRCTWGNGPSALWSLTGRGKAVRFRVRPTRKPRARSRQNFPSGRRPGCFSGILLTELTFCISAGHYVGIS
jgi:hypothetical protein